MMGKGFDEKSPGSSSQWVKGLGACRLVAAETLWMSRREVSVNGRDLHPLSPPKDSQCFPYGSFCWYSLWLINTFESLKCFHWLQSRVSPSWVTSGSLWAGSTAATGYHSNSLLKVFYLGLKIVTCSTQLFHLVLLFFFKGPVLFFVNI